MNFKVKEKPSPPLFKLATVTLEEATVTLQINKNTETQEIIDNFIQLFQLIPDYKVAEVLDSIRKEFKK